MSVFSGQWEGKRGAALAVGLLVMAGLGMGSAQEVPVQAPPCRAVAGDLVCSAVETALTEAMARVEAAKAEVEKARAAVEQVAEDAQAQARAQLEEAQAKLAAAQAELAAKLEKAKAQVEAAKGLAGATADQKLREALLMGPVVVWTNKNMGPDSGLDADTLDGRSSEYFLLAVEREAAARIAGDAVLGVALDAEAASRKAADAAEAQARAAGDAAEVAARQAGEAAEAARRQAADAVEAQARAAGDVAEAAARAAADAGEADARRAADARLSSDLASEAAARAAADRAEQAARVAGDDAVRAGIPDSAWGTVLARDGGGSGLDADRVDGLDSSAFYRAGSKVVDADYLDGIDSSTFARRDTCNSFPGGIHLECRSDSTLDLSPPPNGKRGLSIHMYSDSNHIIDTYLCMPGCAQRFWVDHAGNIHASGHVLAHTTSHIGDIAEPVAGVGLEPGFVVVSDGLDADGGLRVATTTAAFDSRVVGVVSTNPSLRLAGGPDATPLAVSGVVPVKVVGPVKAGQFLTTSSVPGHAMACETVAGCLGAIVGKAIEGFGGLGAGEVHALISLS